MKIKELSLLAVITSLAACGGSGTPSVEDVALFTDLTISDIADLDASELEDLVDDFADEIEDIDYTDLSALQAVGTLNYTGTAIFAEDDFASGDASEDFDFDDVLAFGEMTLAIALGSDEVTGSISGIQNSDEEDSISGSLTISGDLFRDADLDEDFGIAGTISGSLTDAEDGDFTVTTDLVADVFGPDADFVAGEGIGIATFDDGAVDIIIGFGLESDD